MVETTSCLTVGTLNIAVMDDIDYSDEMDQYKSDKRKSESSAENWEENDAKGVQPRTTALTGGAGGGVKEPGCLGRSREHAERRPPPHTDPGSAVQQDRLQAQHHGNS